MTLRPAAGNGKIFADSGQTEELVMRLVMHAVNSMPEGGELLIETADIIDRTGDQVSFSVSHTGAGADLDSVDIAITPYLSPENDRRLEAFFPQWEAQAPADGDVPTLLLVEPREGVRAQLHNFFEANGYNLLEAANDEQAETLAELQHVDLLIGAGRPIEGIPLVEVAPPYTQRALLEQVRTALPLAPNPALTSSASAP